ncbi:MAG: molybdenum cofactor [Desulfovibrionaceae bacterium]|nr:MAG: molybdenum cofactor [Desulfovibrionaceae bacterium]
MHTIVTNHRIAAVVLAAGRSTRMGSDKLRLPWRGRTMLEWVVDAACALSPVVLVGGPHDISGMPGQVTRVSSPVQGRPAGQADSLKAGIRALPPGLDGAMILLGDMPLITPKLVGKLARAFRPGRFLVPRCDGRRGNPVIIPSDWFLRVLELEGDTGARPLLASPNALVDYLAVDDPAILYDVDTPDDYSRLKNQP